MSEIRTEWRVVWPNGFHANVPDHMEARLFQQHPNNVGLRIESRTVTTSDWEPVAPPDGEAEL